MRHYSFAQENTPDDVQALINALPEAETITEENAGAVMTQMEAIDAAKRALTEEQISALDIVRYTAAAEALETLAGRANAQSPMFLAASSYGFSVNPGKTTIQ